MKLKLLTRKKLLKHLADSETRIEDEKVESEWVPHPWTRGTRELVENGASAMVWSERETLAFTLLPQQPINLNADNTASLLRTT